MTKFFLLVLLGLAGVAAWAWSSGHRLKKQLAQQKEHEDARLKAEAKRLVEEKKSARLAAEIKAQEDARLKAEVEAKRLAEELRLARLGSGHGLTRVDWLTKEEQLVEVPRIGLVFMLGFMAYGVQGSSFNS